MIKSPEEVRLMLETFGLTEGVCKLFYQLSYEMHDQFLQFSERIAALEQKSKSP